VNETGLTGSQSEKFFDLLREFSVPNVSLRSLRDIKRKLIDGIPQVRKEERKEERRKEEKKKSNCSFFRPRILRRWIFLTIFLKRINLLISISKKSGRLFKEYSRTRGMKRN